MITICYVREQILTSQWIIPSARADRGSTRLFLKIGRSVPILVAPAIVLTNAKR